MGAVGNRVTAVVGTLVTGLIGMTDEPGESRRETVVITPLLTSKFASTSL